jgi:hypothetical protein
MTRKLTRITPLIDGYAVVVVQEEGEDGKPGEYLGCLLETPESPDDGPFVLLAEAMGAYLKFTNKSQLSDSAAISGDTKQISLVLPPIVTDR